MTRHRDLEADLHPSVIAARHLRATADTWPDLLDALARQGTPVAGGGKRTKRDAAPVPIDLHVSDVMGEITEWVHFWCRVLLDESDWEPPGSPPRFDPARFGHGGLIAYLAATRLHARSPGPDTPQLLRALAQRTGAFTEHPDRTLALAFVEECEQKRHKADEAAFPSGYRKVPIGMACVEDCPGEYRGVVPPDSRWTDIPVLKCSKNPKHTITPEELRRIQRRQHLGRLSNDPAAVREYLKRLRAQAPIRNLVTAINEPPRYNNQARAARRKGA